MISAGRVPTSFKTVRNFYDDSPGNSRGARCVGYVLFATRKSDQRELHASASSPLLQDAIYSIINLQTGEETDDKFSRIPELTDTKGVGETDIITVE